MSLITMEVEIDHGRIVSKGAEHLPDRASALLTILPERTAARDPLVPDPELQKVKFFEDPSKPLEAGDWPEAFD